MVVQHYGSKIVPGRRVTVDSHAANQLADDAQQSSGSYSAALRGGPPPKAFQGGRSDLPVTTASGIAPETLKAVPYRARHGIAEMASPVDAYRAIEEGASNPDYELPSQGIHDHIQRMKDWLTNSGADRDPLAGVREQEHRRRMNDLSSASPQALARILGELNNRAAG